MSGSVGRLAPNLHDGPSKSVALRLVMPFRNRYDVRLPDERENDYMMLVRAIIIPTYVFMYHCNIRIYF